MQGHLTNEQRLHQVVTRLTHENAKLRERIVILEKENVELKIQFQYVMIQLEELKTKIFGKRKKERFPDDNDLPPSSPRPPHTYRRTIPSPEDITGNKIFPMTACTTCPTPLRQVKTCIRYVEDILPPAEWHKALKVVEKHHITTGYCPQCKKNVSAIPLSKHVVGIGSHVKQLTTYANVILRLSFNQIKSFLSDTVHLTLSDGEIASILAEHAQNLIPVVTHMTDMIHSQQGAHFDETGWKVQQEGQGSYGWVMTGTQTLDTVFLLGRSRGKGNAEELRGEHTTEQVGISDDYGVYKNLFFHHQLCWAHPLRKLRDLKDSEHLTTKQLFHCRRVYESFATLYEGVRKCLRTPFILEERERMRTTFLDQLITLTVPHIRDPVRLRKIKIRLREQRDRYFTCLLYQGIPADNNKAERALRHLVLKRKISYGSKTQKGAEVMSILFSTLLSLWWKKPQNFFAEFSRMLVPSVL